MMLSPRRRRGNSSFFNLLVSVMSALAQSDTLPTRVRANPAQAKKPNIVVIFADDVGIWNISAYVVGEFPRWAQL